MTNLFALCLIFTTLSAAGFWSPSPASQRGHDQARDVIVKEGHRVVVVEYADRGQGQAQHNTKVSFISPEPNEPVLHDSSSQDSERHRTRDVICDAYGKCKHKIASAVEKAAKAMVSSETEAVHAFDEAKETVSESFGKAKERVSEKASKAKETASESFEKAKERVSGKASDAKEMASESFEKAKERVSEKASDAKETASESFEKTKGRVSEKASEAKETASESFEKAKETVSEKASELKEGAEGAKERLVDRGVKLVKDYWLRLLVWIEALKAAMEGLSLLGFCMALGMGVWNTFISSYVLASVLPRQQLGMVQSKIFPVYFRAMGSSIGMALFGHVFAHRKWPFELVVALLMVFVNSVYMEPQATKVMFERLKLEREEGRGMEDISCAEPGSVDNDNRPAAVGATTQQQVVKSRMMGVSKRLKKLNSISSWLNLLSLMALTWHLVYLSHRLSLPPPCP